MKEGGLHTIDPGMDLAIFIDPGSKKHDKDSEIILNKCPAIGTLLEEELVEGQPESVKVQTEMVCKRGKTEYAHTQYVLPIRRDGSGITDTAVLYANCKNLAEDMVKSDMKSIHVIVPDDIDSDYARKSLEYALRDSGSRAIVISRKKDADTRKKRHYPKYEQVIVKSNQGKSYVDILKSMKKNVNIEEAGIQVKKMKKTARGDLLLEVTDKAMANKLEEAIRTNMDGTRLVHKTSDTILYISGIDADINEEILKNEIIKERGKKVEDIEILSLRPTKYGSQSATIKANKEGTQALLKETEIKIGWSLCNIRKKVYIQRCYRCLSFGHIKRDCKGEDNTDNCMKCGMKGHSFKECKNPPYCTSCNESGHRDDQTRCPFFRRLIYQGNPNSLVPKNTYRSRIETEQGDKQAVGGNEKKRADTASRNEH